MLDLNFYNNKNVLITGHTGFKGAWLTQILIDAGANVTGYSLNPPTTPNLYSLLNLEQNINSIIADIRDFDNLKKTFDKFKPEIVIHLAAQPIVRESYTSPLLTFETNVMGTVNILECIRTTDSVRSFLNVTTDKVYKNNEDICAFTENDPLDGYDPYSNSKSCSELVTHSYKNSFFADRNIAISTARAGNVIGGGDFATDRIVPDCLRAAIDKKNIIVRNPHSIRPYQHVLEPLFVYLLIAQKQLIDIKYQGWYNIGPDKQNCITTANLVDLFCKHWGDGLTWENQNKQGPHEATCLMLDSTKLKSTFNWSERWNIDTAIKKTCEWGKAYVNNADMTDIVKAQIRDFKGDI